MARDLAVERHRRLECHEGTLCRHPFEKNFVLPPCFVLAYACCDLDARRREQMDAAPRDQGVRVRERNDDAREPCRNHSLGTWPCAPVMRTGLKRHIERRPACKLARHAQRMNLRMRLARRAMPAARNDRPISHDDRTDQRIR